MSILSSEFIDSLPPGIVYLFQHLSKSSILPLTVCLASIFARSAFNLNIPTWLVITTAIAVLPLVLVVSVNLATFNDKRAAHALGAVMVPQVPSKRLGGLDIIKVMDNWDKNGYLGDLEGRWADSLGRTYCIRALFMSRVVTDEPEYTKMILSTNFDDWEKGSSFRSYMKSLLGTGIFNSDGEMWKFHRSMTRPFFTHDKISHFEIFDSHAEDVIGKIKVRLNEGIAVDIQDSFSRFTLDSASEFLFGTDVCSLSAGLSYPKTASSFTQCEDHPSNVFSNSFLAAQAAAVDRTSVDNLWPLFEFWEDKVKKEMKNLYNFVDPIIKNALAKKSSTEKFEVDEDRDITMLEHLAQFTDDHVVLRDETVNILVAGRDTTAALLTFAIYALAEHPRVFERLRQEILETVGPSGRPSLVDLRNMKYLRAVLNETLRLFPPVPFNTRTPKKPVLLPSLTGGKPFYIPANTICHYSVLLMHRRQDLWGPDALEFDPDRFLDDRLHKYLTPNPFIFLPFNAGPRICVGQQFAYNEASFMLIRLLQAFKSISIDMDANPDSRPPLAWAHGPGRQPIEKVWMKSNFVCYVHNGLWVKMTEA